MKFSIGFKYIFLLFFIILFSLSCDDEKKIYNWYVDVNNMTDNFIILEYSKHIDIIPDSQISDTLSSNQVKSIHVKFENDMASILTKYKDKEISYNVSIESPLLIVYEHDFD